MDKVKEIMGVVGKHHFWILSVVVALAVLVSWYSTTGSLATETADNVSKVDGQFTAMQGISGNIEHPTEAETEYLGENYPFHHLDLDDCLSRIPRPKIDEYKDYLFLVLHFPVFNPEARVTTSGQVSIFIGDVPAL